MFIWKTDAVLFILIFTFLIFSAQTKNWAFEPAVMVHGKFISDPISFGDAFFCDEVFAQLHAMR